MLKTTVKAATAIIAIYGAYKAVSDFLDTDAGTQVKSYLSDKKDKVVDSAQSYINHIQEGINASTKNYKNRRK